VLYVFNIEKIAHGSGVVAKFATPEEAAGERLRNNVRLSSPRPAAPPPPDGCAVQL